VSPLDQELIGPRKVDAPIVCVITRFGLRSRRHLLPTYRDYRRVVRDVQATGTSGLLRSVFLVQDPTTCFSVSIWEDEARIAHFGTKVQSHVEAARRMFGRLRMDPERGPELWSTRWRLASMSHNLNWDDFALDEVVATHDGTAR
jgi:hypothetical protein